MKTEIKPRYIKKYMMWFFACLLCGNMMISCDYLDVVPDQIPTLDNAFSDRNTALQYLSSCYWALPRTGDWAQNRAWLGSMEIIFNKENLTHNGMMIALGLDNAASPKDNYWGSTSSTCRTLYAGIRECNTFLDNVDKVVDLPLQEKNRMIAEVKTLKAYMHFYLLCLYGPICPLRETAPVNESTTGIRVYREKIDDCFAYIIQLLDEVIDAAALPTVIANKSSELGRFTHAAACSMKAKVLVYWASPLFNGNTEYNSFRDHQDEHFFNQTDDKSRWIKAAEACKTAVEACAAGGVRLFQMPDYITQMEMTDSTRLVNTLRASVCEQWYANVETIWGNVSSTVSGGFQRACMAQLQSGNSSVTSIASVPFATVDLFYSDHGVPIEEDTAWLNSGRYMKRFEVRTGDEKHQFYIAKDEITAEMNFEREPRFYSTLGFDRGKWHSNTYTALPDGQTLFLKNRWGEYSSYRSTTNYNVTGYFPKKLVGLGTSFKTADAFDEVDFPTPDLRYSSLLLYYAEAINETAEGENGRPSDLVYAIIDEVRTRAGLEGVIESWRKYSIDPDKPYTKKGMREIIQRERNIELACEGQNYWDSRRWKTAAKEHNRIIQGWNVIGATEDSYYIPTAIYIQKFTLRDYFAPIPESDLIKNPQLIQNPGW